MLVVAGRRAADTGSVLRVVVPGDSPLTRMLAITGIDRIVGVYASIHDAVAAGKHAAS